MTSPTQFDIEAEKIIADTLGYQKSVDGTWWTNDWMDNQTEAVSQALSQLHNLRTRERIYELYGVYVIDGKPYSDIGGNGKNELPARIATLKAQLTLKGDKDV